jgi:hypothetical protein
VASPYFSRSSSAGSPYFGGGKSAGSPYFGGGSAGAAPTTTQHHGSLFGNLAGDISGAVTGFIPGTVKLATEEGKALKATVQHPWVSSKSDPNYEGNKSQVEKLTHQVAHAEQAYYGPLAHGDLGGFWRNVHAHPLTLPLDVLTLASAGGSRAAALGMLPKDATVAERVAAVRTGKYQGPLRTISVRGAHGGAEVPVRTLPRNAARAARMIATDKALKLLPPDTPVVGQFPRAARALKADTLPIELRARTSPAFVDYSKAWERLSPKERVALATMARLPLPHDLEAWKAQLAAEGTDAAHQTLRLLNDPKVMDAYLHPSEKLLRAHALGTEVSHATAGVLVRHGALLPETAAASPFRHMRIARGAEFVAETPARLGKPSARLEFQRSQVDRLQALHDRATGKVQQAGAKLAGPGDVMIGGRLVGPGAATPIGTVTGPGRVVTPPGGARAERIGAALSVAKDKLASMEAATGRQVEPTGLVGGGTPEELAADVRAAGRPMPFHMPDRMVTSSAFRVGGKSAGLTPPSFGVHQSEGTLFRMGLLALHPDVLGPEFLRAAVRDRAAALHQRVLETAVPSETGRLPAGYRWVREIRGQSYPATATGYGEHLAAVEEAFPAAEGRLTATEAEAGQGIRTAVDDEGRPLMVPERFARQLEADLAKSRGAAIRIINAPLQLWRALILNLRVGWLENNVVGNGILAALRSAGPNGVRATLGMIAETKGVVVARRALGMAESSGHLTAADVQELLPELSRAGTFIGSQMPPSIVARLPGAAQKALRAPKAVVGFLPKIDRATESALRRASAETVLRGSLEVQALYRAMPKQTRSWRAAMRQGLENPDLRRLVVREVNDALGNYLSLSAFEQNALRQLIPFWGWFREITRITSKLPIDTPGRANLLTRVGQIGTQQSDQTLGPLPSYLRGAIATGPPSDGLQGILSLRSANPYTSAVDVGSSVGALLPGGGSASASNLMGEFNPFLTAGADYLSQLKSGRKKGGLGLGGEIAKSVATSLPEVRVGTKPPSKLYPGRSREDLLWALLGSPKRKISTQQAHYYASQGK